MKNGWNIFKMLVEMSIAVPLKNKSMLVLLGNWNKTSPVRGKTQHAQSVWESSKRVKLYELFHVVTSSTRIVSTLG